MIRVLYYDNFTVETFRDEVKALCEELEIEFYEVPTDFARSKGHQIEVMDIETGDILDFYTGKTHINVVRKSLQKLK